MCLAGGISSLSEDRGKSSQCLLQVLTDSSVTGVTSLLVMFLQWGHEGLCDISVTGNTSLSVMFLQWGHEGLEDVAQLVKHPTGTPPMHVQFPCAARDFSSTVNFGVDSLMVSVHPCVQSHAFTSVHTLRSHSPCQNLVDYVSAYFRSLLIVQWLVSLLC